MLLKHVYVYIHRYFFQNQCEMKFKVFPSRGKRLEMKCLGFAWLQLNPNKQQFNQVVRLRNDLKAKPRKEFAISILAEEN